MMLSLTSPDGRHTRKIVLTKMFSKKKGEPQQKTSVYGKHVHETFWRKVAENITSKQNKIKQESGFKYEYQMLQFLREHSVTQW